MAAGVDTGTQSYWRGGQPVLVANNNIDTGVQKFWRAAQPVIVQVIRVTVVTLGIAAESDAALGVTDRHVVTLGLAAESDAAAGSVSWTKRVTMGIAAASEVALAMTYVQGNVPFPLDWQPNLATAPTGDAPN